MRATNGMFPWGAERLGGGGTIVGYLGLAFCTVEPDQNTKTFAVRCGSLDRRPQRDAGLSDHRTFARMGLAQGGVDRVRGRKGKEYGHGWPADPSRSARRWAAKGGRGKDRRPAVMGRGRWGGRDRQAGQKALPRRAGGLGRSTKAMKRVRTLIGFTTKTRSFKPGFDIAKRLGASAGNAVCHAGRADHCRPSARRHRAAFVTIFLLDSEMTTRHPDAKFEGASPRSAGWLTRDFPGLAARSHAEPRQLRLEGKKDASEVGQSKVGSQTRPSPRWMKQGRSTLRRWD